MSQPNSIMGCSCLDDLSDVSIVMIDGDKNNAVFESNGKRLVPCSDSECPLHKLNSIDVDKLLCPSDNEDLGGIDEENAVADENLHDLSKYNQNDSKSVGTVDKPYVKSPFSNMSPVSRSSPHSYHYVSKYQNLDHQEQTVQEKSKDAEKYLSLSPQFASDGREHRQASLVSTGRSQNFKLLPEDGDTNGVTSQSDESDFMEEDKFDNYLHQDLSSNEDLDFNAASIPTIVGSRNNERISSTNVALKMEFNTQHSKNYGHFALNPQRQLQETIESPLFKPENEFSENPKTTKIPLKNETSHQSTGPRHHAIHHYNEYDRSSSYSDGEQDVPAGGTVSFASFGGFPSPKAKRAQEDDGKNNCLFNKNEFNSSKQDYDCESIEAKNTDNDNNSYEKAEDKEGDENCETNELWAQQTPSYGNQKNSSSASPSRLSPWSHFNYDRQLDSSPLKAEPVSVYSDKKEEDIKEDDTYSIENFSTSEMNIKETNKEQQKITQFNNYHHLSLSNSSPDVRKFPPPPTISIGRPSSTSSLHQVVQQQQQQQQQHHHQHYDVNDFHSRMFAPIISSDSIHTEVPFDNQSTKTNSNTPLPVEPPLSNSHPSTEQLQSSHYNVNNINGYLPSLKNGDNILNVQLAPSSSTTASCTTLPAPTNSFQSIASRAPPRLSALLASPSPVRTSSSDHSMRQHTSFAMQQHDAMSPNMLTGGGQISMPGRLAGGLASLKNVLKSFREQRESSAASDKNNSVVAAAAVPTSPQSNTCVTPQNRTQGNLVLLNSTTRCDHDISDASSKNNHQQSQSVLHSKLMRDGHPSPPVSLLPVFSLLSVVASTSSPSSFTPNAQKQKICTDHKENIDFVAVDEKKIITSRTPISPNVVLEDAFQLSAPKLVIEAIKPKAHPLALVEKNENLSFPIQDISPLSQKHLLFLKEQNEEISRRTMEIESFNQFGRLRIPTINRAYPFTSVLNATGSLLGSEKQNACCEQSNSSIRMHRTELSNENDFSIQPVDCNSSVESVHDPAVELNINHVTQSNYNQINNNNNSGQISRRNAIHNQNVVVDNTFNLVGDDNNNSILSLSSRTGLGDVIDTHDESDDHQKSDKEDNYQLLSARTHEVLTLRQLLLDTETRRQETERKVKTLEAELNQAQQLQRIMNKSKGNVDNIPDHVHKKIKSKIPISSFNKMSTTKVQQKSKNNSIQNVRNSYYNFNDEGDEDDIIVLENPQQRPSLQQNRQNMMSNKSNDVVTPVDESKRTLASSSAKPIPYSSKFNKDTTFDLSDSPLKKNNSTGKSNNSNISMLEFMANSPSGLSLNQHQTSPSNNFNQIHGASSNLTSVSVHNLLEIVSAAVQNVKSTVGNSNNNNIYENNRGQHDDSNVSMNSMNHINNNRTAASFPSVSNNHFYPSSQPQCSGLSILPPLLAPLTPLSLSSAPSCHFMQQQNLLSATSLQKQQTNNKVVLSSPTHNLFTPPPYNTDCQAVSASPPPFAEMPLAVSTISTANSSMINVPADPVHIQAIQRIGISTLGKSEANGDNFDSDSKLLSLARSLTQLQQEDINSHPLEIVSINSFQSHQLASTTSDSKKQISSNTFPIPKPVEPISSILARADKRFQALHSELAPLLTSDEGNSLSLLSYDKNEVLLDKEASLSKIVLAEPLHSAINHSANSLSLHDELLKPGLEPFVHPSSSAAVMSTTSFFQPSLKARNSRLLASHIASDSQRVDSRVGPKNSSQSTASEGASAAYHLLQQRVVEETSYLPPQMKASALWVGDEGGDEKSLSAFVPENKRRFLQRSGKFSKSSKTNLHASLSVDDDDENKNDYMNERHESLGDEGDGFEQGFDDDNYGDDGEESKWTLHVSSDDFNKSKIASKSSFFDQENNSHGLITKKPRTPLSVGGQNKKTLYENSSPSNNNKNNNKNNLEESNKNTQNFNPGQNSEAEFLQSVYNGTLVQKFCKIYTRKQDIETALKNTIDERISIPREIQKCIAMTRNQLDDTFSKKKVVSAEERRRRQREFDEDVRMRQQRRSGFSLAAVANSNVLSHSNPLAKSTGDGQFSDKNLSIPPLNFSVAAFHNSAAEKRNKSNSTVVEHRVSTSSRRRNFLRESSEREALRKHRLEKEQLEKKTRLFKERDERLKRFRARVVNDVDGVYRFDADDQQLVFPTSPSFKKNIDEQSFRDDLPSYGSKFQTKKEELDDRIELDRDVDYSHQHLSTRNLSQARSERRLSSQLHISGNSHRTNENLNHMKQSMTDEDNNSVNSIHYRLRTSTRDSSSRNNDYPQRFTNGAHDRGSHDEEEDLYADLSPKRPIIIKKKVNMNKKDTQMEFNSKFNHHQQYNENNFNYGESEYSYNDSSTRKQTSSSAQPSRVFNKISYLMANREESSNWHDENYSHPTIKQRLMKNPELISDEENDSLKSATVRGGTRILGKVYKRP